MFGVHSALRAVQRAFPEVSDFIKESAKDFPNLQIQYVRAASPSLKLFDAAGDVQEAINIDGWKRESFKQFFSEMLEPVSPAIAAQ